MADRETFNDLKLDVEQLSQDVLTGWQTYNPRLKTDVENARLRARLFRHWLAA